MRMRLTYLAFIALMLSAIAGCSGSAGSTSASSGTQATSSGRTSGVYRHLGATRRGPAPAPITVEGMDTPELGVVLADLKGMTLYRFTAESGGKIACRGACLKTWKPLRVKADAALRLPPSIKGKLGRAARPDGTLQVTFDGWPLYTYRGDRQPADTFGNGKNGRWFAITHLQTP
jgi:predicted lipoprotein with Yx(FWY)xxD motif